LAITALPRLPSWIFGEDQKKGVRKEGREGKRKVELKEKGREGK